MIDYPIATTVQTPGYNPGVPNFTLARPQSSNEGKEGMEMMVELLESQLELLEGCLSPIIHLGKIPTHAARYLSTMSLGPSRRARAVGGGVDVS